MQMMPNVEMKAAGAAWYRVGLYCLSCGAVAMAVGYGVGRKQAPEPRPAALSIPAGSLPLSARVMSVDDEDMMPRLADAPMPAQVQDKPIPVQEALEPQSKDRSGTT
jgi:hypothetical protein